MPLDWKADEDQGEGRATVRASLSGWTVVCEVTANGVEHLVIEPAGATTGLTVRRLREVDLQGALSAARPQMRRSPAEAALWGSDQMARPMTRIEQLALLALQYGALMDEGVRDVTRVLHRKYPGRSLGQVRDAIHAARNEGLLTATGRGRPGGQLTGLGLEILAAHMQRGSLTEAEVEDMERTSPGAISLRWSRRPPTKEDLWEWRQRSPNDAIGRDRDHD